MFGNPGDLLMASFFFLMIFLVRKFHRQKKKGERKLPPANGCSGHSVARQKPGASSRTPTSLGHLRLHPQVCQQGARLEMERVGSEPVAT